MEIAELIKVALPFASGVFSLPAVVFLPLWGFGRNSKESALFLQHGKILINKEIVESNYILKSGDLVSFGRNAILVEKE